MHHPFTIRIEVMKMKETKQPISPKTWADQPWFWPVVYAVIALIMISFILLYNMMSTEEEVQSLPVTYEQNEQVQTPQPVAQERMKYPFDEALLGSAKVLQDFYDVNAEAAQQENALLVFNQTYTTSTGIALGVNSEPFPVVAAMSGKVTKVKLDAFTGNSITIEHANGLATRYSSVGDIVVKEGDTVAQGAALATTIENEWNPAAGIHLYFEVLKDGEYINPRSLLAF